MKTEPAAAAAYDDPEPEQVPTSRRALPTVLLVLGGLALLLVLGYLFLRPDQSDEHLTSLSRTAADSVAVRPETGPQAEPPPLPPAAEPQVVRAAPATLAAASSARADSLAAATNAAAVKTAARASAKAPATSATDAPAAAAPAGREAADAAPASTLAKPGAEKTTPAATPPAPTTTTPAPESAAPSTAAEDGDDEATTRVRQALSSYYADLQAPPFQASQHFAPVVERLYTRQNLTPAAIETELNQSMFPEFKQLTTSVVPGTLRVGPPAADGTRTATYTEQSRAFRVSKGKHQRTRTQVRVRFDPDYKMTYLRQEKLLENTFEQ